MIGHTEIVQHAKGLIQPFIAHVEAAIDPSPGSASEMRKLITAE